LDLILVYYFTEENQNIMKVSNIEKEVGLLLDYLQLKNYSVATQKSYCSALRQG